MIQGGVMAVWQLWILFGLLLAISEILIVPAQFVLVALGVCALIVGAVVAFTDIGPGLQLGLYAGLAIALIPVFVKIWRRRSTSRYSGTAGEASLGGQVGIVESLEPLRIRLHSDRFPAHNLDATPLAVGDRVQVHGFSGITASVRKLD
jgi:membrane protein implicated in regulation of membrane protease activity